VTPTVCGFVKNGDGSEPPMINAVNYVHCETRDCKDSTRNIVRLTLEGGA
jgi:Electron transfer flavoprotein-ubiquinone oxidoreductase, 4Fe-4S